MPPLPERNRPRIAAVVPAHQLADTLAIRDRAHPLHDSPALVDGSGTIFLPTFRDVPSEHRDTHLPVHALPPNADIFAPHSTFTPKVLRMNEVHGGVEKAIRMCTRIIKKTQGTETAKTRALGGRAHELLVHITDNFTNITQEQLDQAQRETNEILVQAGIDPQRIQNLERKRITQWVQKGSVGKDTLERLNYLITVTVLSAAYRHAVASLYGLNETVKKFSEARDALLFEREFSRMIFDYVAQFLQKVPGHEAYKYPGRLSRNVGILSGVLDHNAWRLEQPHVKNYRPVGREAATLIRQAKVLTIGGRTEEVMEEQLFTKAHTLLRGALQDPQTISIQD